MSIIHRTRPQVKSARKIARPARPFGEGIFPARERRMPFTAADLAWAAFELNKDTRDYEVLVPGPAPISGGSPDADWDALADEALALARLDMGLCF